METAQTADELKARLAEAERQERRQKISSMETKLTDANEHAAQARLHLEDLQNQLGRKEAEVRAAWNSYTGLKSSLQEIRKDFQERQFPTQQENLDHEAECTRLQRDMDIFHTAYINAKNVLDGLPYHLAKASASYNQLANVARSMKTHLQDLRAEESQNALLARAAGRVQF